MLEQPRDHCGVFGIYGVLDAAPLTALGLHALQHRGQESAGIVSSDGKKLHCHKAMGLVSTAFANGEASRLPGNIAIGHVRYPTAGTNDLISAQPLTGRCKSGEVAIAHNGTLAAANRLTDMLNATGTLFQTAVDTELFLHLLAYRHANSVDEIAAVLAEIGPAFSIVMLHNNRLIAARDPLGFRPLVLGTLGGGFVVASESCAFDQIGARLEREVLPGEMIICDSSGLHSKMFCTGNSPTACCLLELIYFARPDSVVFGQTPHIFRKLSGKALAAEHPVEADIVTAIPDSGISAAMGYANALNIPYDRGLIRNHYIGRSFIAPGQEARKATVRMKHNVVKEVVSGKRVVLVDDSLIRGTTTVTIGKELRDAGATEVHLRIACPPTRHPCIYGVDFPRREELMAHKYSIEEIRRRLNMDSIGYLSLEGLTAQAESPNSFCSACWSGHYITDKQ